MRAANNVDILIMTDGSEPQTSPHLLEGIKLKHASMPSAATLSHGYGYLSAGTLLRFQAPVELAEDYERLIYIDGDVILNAADLAPLLTIDLGDAVLGAVRSSMFWRPPGRRRKGYLSGLGITGGHRYFNAGLLVIDIARYNAASGAARLTNFVQDHPELCWFNDQSALNHVFQDQWAELSPIWNWQLSAQGNLLLMDEVAPRILHCTGALKPWNDTQRLLPRAGVAPFREMATLTGWDAFEDGHADGAPSQTQIADRAEALSNIAQSLEKWTRLVRPYLERRDFIDGPGPFAL